jgi:hypothetical protein
MADIEHRPQQRLLARRSLQYNSYYQGFSGAGWSFPSDPPTDPITFFLRLGSLKAA